jgi:hypothetical protein
MTEREILKELREHLRVKMVKAHERTTENNDTYADGYFNGILEAMQEIDRMMPGAI